MVFTRRANGMLHDLLKVAWNQVMLISKSPLSADLDYLSIEMLMNAGVVSSLIRNQ